MVVYRKCLGCGIELADGYRHTYCPACRQFEVTERLSTAQQQNNSYSAGNGYLGGGADDYDLTGKLLFCIGVWATYHAWPVVWLMLKFFGGVFFGIGD